MQISANQALLIGTLLEGISYGIYCIIFAMFVRIQTSKRGRTRTVLEYPLYILFFLVTSFIALDFPQTYMIIGEPNDPSTANPLRVMNLVASVQYSTIDMLSQMILIYRCWVMWGRRLWVIIIPTLISLTAFAGGITLVVGLSIFGSRPDGLPSWFLPLGAASFSLSLAVNAIVATMLVVRLWLTHREIKASLGPASSIHGARAIGPIIAVIMETGLLTFIGQLLWVVLFEIQTDTNNSFYAVYGFVIMLYGITPTILSTRVASGSSYETQTRTSTWVGKSGTQNIGSHIVVTSSTTMISSDHPKEVFALTSRKDDASI